MVHYDQAAKLQASATHAGSSLKGVATLAADVAAALAAASVSLIGTNLIRAQLGEPVIALTDPGFRLHLTIITVLTVCVLFWYRAEGHYHRRQALADQLKAVMGGAVIGALCAATVQFAFVEVGSRLLTLSYWALLPVLVMLGRMAARDILRATGAWSMPSVVFTCASRAEEVGDFITKRDEIGARLDRVVAVNAMTAEALVQAMRRAVNDGQAVIYAPSAGDPLQQAVIDQLVMTGTPFMLSPQIGRLPNEAEVLDFPPEDVALMEVRDPLGRPLAVMVKRAFDVAVAGLAVLALSPVLALLMLAIRSDGGPAIYRQPRIGKGGRIFQCLKLRSMVLDADVRLEALLKADRDAAEEWRAYQKLTHDPRITPVGRIIRKLNLDELPQLINVLRGDMSLVGPRPMMDTQTGEYGERLAAYIRMRPGITGLWQTNGRNATTFAERARLDAWYVRNWSLWRDFVILVRTLRELVASSGR
ncbi:MAG: exopolysaccharide biosynthesis polyprenyl glycosylphosphotransferase [Alphaproteobacteria bacterium]|nr:exopolysaccharide biosynthesis polyprenyl glycosylphosphotransferase [Alphaproteobacteria bacterium]